MQEKLFKEDMKMGLLDEISPAPRKVMTLFYLVDTSGSMGGARIGTVNAAMENCIPLFAPMRLLPNWTLLWVT